MSDIVAYIAWVECVLGLVSTKVEFSEANFFNQLGERSMAHVARLEDIYYRNALNSIRELRMHLPLVSPLVFPILSIKIVSLQVNTRLNTHNIAYPDIWWLTFSNAFLMVPTTKVTQETRS